MVLKAHLFSCFDNFHVCCSVFFCSPCTVAQALQVGCGKTVGAQGCRIVAGVLIALMARPLARQNVSGCALSRLALKNREGRLCRFATVRTASPRLRRHSPC